MEEADASEKGGRESEEGDGRAAGEGGRSEEAPSDSRLEEAPPSKEVSRKIVPNI